MNHNTSVLSVCLSVRLSVALFVWLQSYFICNANEHWHIGPAISQCIRNHPKMAASASSMHKTNRSYR